MRLLAEYVPTGTLLLVLGLAAGGCAGNQTPENDPAKRAAIDRMYTSYKAAFPEVRELSVENLLTLQANSDIVLVDVREPEERAISTIPGAVSKEAFETDIDQYRNRPIVTYCTIGARSGSYAQELQRQGFDVYNLRGSILAWVHAGQPVVDQHGETRRLHVYGERWNLAPADYEAVW